MRAIRPSNLGRAAAAVAILLLMLSSQVGSTGSVKPGAPQQTASQPPPSVPPVTPPSTSSVGELSYTNTWNRTGQQPICLQAQAAVQDPLRPQSKSWTITSSVPSVLAGSTTPSGQPIGYTYTALSNGTFVASDDQGNALSWKAVTGYPAGATTIRLYGNSTEALQLYTVGPAAHPIGQLHRLLPPHADRSGCEPHGVKVTIQGSVNWPARPAAPSR